MIAAPLLGLTAFLNAVGQDPGAFFEARIRPVLVERCYPCHSHQSEKLEGELYLDSRAGLLRGGKSGQPAVVPGEPTQSRLIEAIRQVDPKLQMPPKARLPAVAVADFTTWVSSGAPFPEPPPGQPRVSSNGAARSHWAFQPPGHPELPPVRERAWPQTEIDRFILHELEAHDLTPSPPADRRAWLRRATYDLIGLPPTPEEVEAFAGDPSADAFAQVVDRLLASPHYGERWGRHWLDVARYADTKGYVYYYEESGFVQAFRYRDWVVKALNEDLPYDRFLLLQIAGDQLVGSASEPTNQTGSTVRWPTPVSEPAVAALGFLTLGRRFLDNPHDLIDDQIDVVMRGTQALTVGCARCHDHKFDPIPTRDYYSLYGVFQGSTERIVSLEKPPSAGDLVPFARAKAYVEFDRGLRERVQKLETQFSSACADVANRLRGRVKEYLGAVLDVAKLPDDANVRPQPDDINPYNVRQWERYIEVNGTTNPAIFGPWREMRSWPPEQFRERAAKSAPEWAANTAGRWHPLIARLFTNAPVSMVEVAARYGDLLARIHQAWLASQTNAAMAVKPVRLVDPDEEALRQVLYGPDAPVLVPRGSLVELDVHLYFDDPNRVALAQAQMGIEQWLITSPGASPHAVVLADRAYETTPVVFRRGDPLKPGAAVPRQFLEVLAGPERRQFSVGSGRLELARAIANKENPLTARVMVNRVWAHHFGAGLVRTPGDFGTRCDPPTHPELLDWLAQRFIADEWSLKKLHRLILLSSTYQQGGALGLADADARSVARDPENRWLSYFPRQRLEFEGLRDSLLAVSGELDPKVGGPAVDLSQTPFSHRRTLYGLIDRKFLPAMFRTFDFANPDMLAPQRFATSVPQQGLFLINHPFVLERARALAARIGPVAGTSVESRIRQLYRYVLQRSPSATELRSSQQFIESELSQEAAVGGLPSSTGQDQGSAGTLKAWEQFAQVLLLSNEFLFID